MTTSFVPASGLSGRKAVKRAGWRGRLFRAVTRHRAWCGDRCTHVRFDYLEIPQVSKPRCFHYPLITRSISTGKICCNSKTPMAVQKRTGVGESQRFEMIIPAGGISNALKRPAPEPGAFIETIGVDLLRSATVP